MSQTQEIEKMIDKFERELEEVLKEKKAIEIDLYPLYVNSREWNGLVMFKLFDLLVQSVFPHDFVTRIELATDTPPSHIHVQLKKIIDKLRNCRNIVVIREYDTLYYCVE